MRLFHFCFTGRWEGCWEGKLFKGCKGSLDVCQIDRIRPLHHSSLDFAALFLRKVLISVNYKL